MGSMIEDHHRPKQQFQGGSMSNQKNLLQAAFERFDAANSQDPSQEKFDGMTYPKQLLYAQRMTKWLEILKPDASEVLQLAVRSQHICRWEIPRDRYAMDREGYLEWRTDLGKFHADKAAEILREVGYSEQEVAKVASLLRKENLRTNPEAQLLEDVACLVFLENYFSDFSHKHDEEKILRIVRKTWRKMSEQAHYEALKLDISAEARAFVEKALAAI